MEPFEDKDSSIKVIAMCWVLDQELHVYYPTKPIQQLHEVSPERLKDLPNVTQRTAGEPGFKSVDLATLLTYTSESKLIRSPTRNRVQLGNGLFEKHLSR